MQDELGPRGLQRLHHLHDRRASATSWRRCCLAKEAGLFAPGRRTAPTQRPAGGAAVRDHRRPAPLRRPHARALRPARLPPPPRRPGAACSRSCSATRTATRTAASSPRTGSCTAPSARWPTPAARRASACSSSTAAAAPSGAAAARPTARSWASPPARSTAACASPSRARSRSRATATRTSRTATWSRRSTPCCAPACATPRRAVPAGAGVGWPRWTPLSAAACDAYRGLVYDDPDFVAYFRQATPIDQIADLRIGSRPAKRKGGERHRGPARDPLGLQLDAEPPRPARLVRPGRRPRGRRCATRRRATGVLRGDVPRLALLPLADRQRPAEPGPGRPGGRPPLRRPGGRRRPARAHLRRGASTEWERTERGHPRRHRAERAPGGLARAAPLDPPAQPLRRPPELRAGEPLRRLRALGAEDAPSATRCAIWSPSASTAWPPGCRTQARDATASATSRRAAAAS